MTQSLTVVLSSSNVSEQVLGCSGWRSQICETSLVAYDKSGLISASHSSVPTIALYCLRSLVALEELVW